MAHRVFERLLLEQCGRQDVERVEPSTRLRDVLDDEIRGKTFRKRGLVLMRVVQLRKWHGAGFEPAVQNLRHAQHRAVTSIASHSHCVDVWSMKVGYRDAGATFQVRRAFYYQRAAARFAAPHRDRSAPEPVSKIAQSRALSSHWPKRPSRMCSGTQ